MSINNSVKWIIAGWMSWVQLTTEARVFISPLYMGLAQAG